ncbi:hypothetical protein [Vibrio hangzhouensis]|uniref:hypothetical protein n=1 Tax=Vibrio hangzhouensis TaxID=462991 RepID=UPI001357CC8A|nr:hypothetical protein [Vibrio hangzhouensis]
MAIPVPKQFQLKPAVINSIAHSVLPDGTVVIPRTQLMDAVNHEISVSNKASISKAIPITTGYSCHLSSDFCVIASTRVEHGRLVYSTKCQLEVEISSIDSIHTSSTIVDIDMNVMNQLMIKTFNFNELNGCLQQTDLLDLVSTCQSPILFADVVYELQGRRYLKANENGSFTLPDKPEYSGLDCAYVYGISDAVEYVNIAVAIPIEILASLHYSLDRALYSSNLKMLVQRELLGF